MGLQKLFNASMILTYKVKHGRDFSKELKLAIQVANFGITNRNKLSSKYVKTIGLKSTIASQILWKYGRNRKCKITHDRDLLAAQNIKKFALSPLLRRVEPVELRQ